MKLKQNTAEISTTAAAVELKLKSTFSSRQLTGLTRAEPKKNKQATQVTSPQRADNSGRNSEKNKSLRVNNEKRNIKIVTEKAEVHAANKATVR